MLYGRVHAYMHAYIHTYIYTQMCIDINICSDAVVQFNVVSCYVCMDVWMGGCMYVYVCMYVCMYECLQLRGS